MFRKKSFSKTGSGGAPGERRSALMDRIAGFLVRRRHLLLAIFTGLAAVCLILSGFVKKNSDLKRYLPKDSQTRIGYELMLKEFPEDSESSSLEVMVTGLADDEKEPTRAALSAISGVASVAYDGSERYNKGEFTRYTLTIGAPKDSDTATAAYRAVQDLLADRTVDYAGEVYYQNIPILPPWVMLLAIGIVTAVLLVMCDSFFAPLLFIASILIAIALNMGSNLIFGEISSITDAIAAILQLALSMDYSIMLMERYRQEREQTDDKIAAMKKAISASFLSIAGSSQTTIVGLLTLVFMSFTIGRDLGFVLAKGVLWSLVCVFCVLPALITISDPILQKTKKKSPKIPTDRFAAFLHRARIPLLCVFLLIFAAASILQGNPKITYTGSELDKVADVFGSENSMAILYANEYGEELRPIFEEIERDEGVTVVLSTENTLDRPLSYDEVLPRTAAAGMTLDVKESLLKLIYYRAAHPIEEGAIGVENFASYLAEDLSGSEDLADLFDEETRASLQILARCTPPEISGKAIPSAEMAKLLGQSEEDTALVYAILKTDLLTPREFTAGILGERGGAIRFFLGESRLSAIRVLDRAMAAAAEEKPLLFGEMAKVFSETALDPSLCEAAYVLYESSHTAVTDKLSLRALLTFLADDFLKDETFSRFVDDEKAAAITEGKAKLASAESMLRKENYSRAVLRTTYPSESKETYEFVARVRDMLSPFAGKEVYFAGDSCYAYEMNEGFRSEFSLISILTMAAIFLIVALTFRSAVIPLILIAVIECAVFVTMSIMNLTGMTVFFLAILVLQSILMGATIDYAILFTSYYREFRVSEDRKSALLHAYREAIGTILTSAVILTIGTLLVGWFAIEIVSKICLAIGYGTVSATVLILVFTPAMIAVFDRFVRKKDPPQKSEPGTAPPNKPDPAPKNEPGPAPQNEPDTAPEGGSSPRA